MGIFSCDQADTVAGVHVGRLSGNLSSPAGDCSFVRLKKPFPGGKGPCGYNGWRVSQAPSPSPPGSILQQGRNWHRTARTGELGCRGFSGPSPSTTLDKDVRLCALNLAYSHRLVKSHDKRAKAARRD